MADQWKKWTFDKSCRSSSTTIDLPVPQCAHSLTDSPVLHSSCTYSSSPASAIAMLPCLCADSQHELLLISWIFALRLKLMKAHLFCNSATRALSVPQYAHLLHFGGVSAPEFAVFSSPVRVIKGSFMLPFFCGCLARLCFANPDDTASLPS